MAISFTVHLPLISWREATGCTVVGFPLVRSRVSFLFPFRRTWSSPSTKTIPTNLAEVCGNPHANSHTKKIVDTPRQLLYLALAHDNIFNVPSKSILKLSRKSCNCSTEGLKATTSAMSLARPHRLLSLASPRFANFLSLHERSTVHRGSQPWQMKRKVAPLRRSLSNGTVLLSARNRWYRRFDYCVMDVRASPGIDSCVTNAAF